MSKSLTLAKLSEYDDVITHHLIDQVYFWSTTHKAGQFTSSYMRNVKTEDIVNIIQKHVIPRKGKISEAVKAFLELNTVRGYYKGLKPSEKKDFQRHLRKYLSIYLPSAGFEICSTNRYPGPKSESCIIANKTLVSGEVLGSLAGTIVAMTEAEDDVCDAGRDFSIVHSSRLSAACLFLGPARFVNHDCDSNGEFIALAGAIAIRAIKPVEIGEEITVYYAPDYFGPGNADCLCRTCENKKDGGYKAIPTARKSSGTHTTNSAAASCPNSRVEQSKNRNRGPAIGVVVNPLLTRTVPRLSSHIITPPQSELSLDDLEKNFADSTDTASVRMIEEDDGELSDHASRNTIRSEQIYEMVASPASNSNHGTHLRPQFVVAQDQQDFRQRSMIRNALRPRKKKFDYNLKRRSLLSVRPASAADVSAKAKARKVQKAGHDYCHICSEEMPPEPGKKNRLKVPQRQLMCRRCKRHAKLYEAPWPQRTTPAMVQQPSTLVRSLRNGDCDGGMILVSDPVGETVGSILHQKALAEPNNIVQRSVRHEVEPRTEMLSQGALNQLGARKDSPRHRALSSTSSCMEISPPPGIVFSTNRLSVAIRDRNGARAAGPPRSTAIELAKAGFRDGSVLFHRMAGLRASPAQQNIAMSSTESRTFPNPIVDASAQLVSDTPRRVAQSLTEPAKRCLNCQSAKKLCRVRDLDTHRCNRCIIRGTACTFELTDFAGKQSTDEIYLPVEESRSQALIPLENLFDRATSPGLYSITSQVDPISMRRAQVKDHSLDTGKPGIVSETQFSDKSVVDPVIHVKTLRRQADYAVSAGHRAPSSGPSISNGSNSTEPIGNGQESKPTKRSRIGSWYYEEIESGDSDAPPRIMNGRTRRQEKQLLAATIEKEQNTYAEAGSDIDDDVSVELLPYKLPSRKITPPKREKKRLWEYIPITSDDEDQKDGLIGDLPRAYRRKRVASYKE